MPSKNEVARRLAGHHYEIEPGRVGKWDHDGGPSDRHGLFLEYLAECCRAMS